MTTYSISKTLAGSFYEIVEKVKKTLAQENFGILTEINVKQTLKKKLNVNYSNYVILGACHPESAYQVLLAEKEIGLLLPCNVIVYEENEKVVVSAIKPTVIMQTLDNPKIGKVAQVVEKKLQKVIDSL